VPLTGEWSTPFVMRMRAWRGSTRAWLRVGVRVKVKGGVRVRVRDRVRVRSTRPLPLGVQHEHVAEQKGLPR
tara:strand:+ start:513 stop:728 length:216 start_codon:yes stop_codon:yes gene_type:complete